MSGIKDQKNIDELRKRLYERGTFEQGEDRHELKSSNVNVSRGWSDVPSYVTKTQTSIPVTPDPVIKAEETSNIMEDLHLETSTKKKRPYRLIIVLVSIFIFVAVAAVSSVQLFFGTNKISTNNISVGLSVPAAVSAGEIVSFQVSVSNQNPVKIESANLIINYPSGTKTGDDQARDLFEEIIPIQDIEPGEAINLPVTATFFGEENEEKEIKATVEYRVVDSNGTFSKDAEPVKLTINSSPLVVRAVTLTKVSSGQEMDVEITIQSNAATVQRNILVNANYPNNFSYASAEPEPSYGQNSWLIKEIKPNSSEKIIVKGIASGEADARAEIQLTVGTPRSDNQFIMGSTLSKVNVSYTIERPFVQVLVDINGDTDGSTVIGNEKDAEVVITVNNTLNESIFDMRAEVVPKGNLIRDNLVSVSSGYYDSVSNKITWEVSGQSDLAEVKPGASRKFTLRVKNDPSQQTASFDVSVKIFARRLNEPGANEEVIATTVAEAKFESEIIARSQIGHSDGVFEDSGSVPPRANQTTSYTATLEAVASVNDITGAVFTTTLPQYVSWMDSYDGPGVVEYNPTTKQIKWNIGTVEAKSSKKLQFQVGLLPSVTQIGKTPVVIGSQQLKATDRFTGTPLQAEIKPVTTELSTEFGFPVGNGIVAE
jgi:hypothetical protein